MLNKLFNWMTVLFQYEIEFSPRRKNAEIEPKNMAVRVARTPVFDPISGQATRFSGFQKG